VNPSPNADGKSFGMTSMSIYRNRKIVTSLLLASLAGLAPTVSRAQQRPAAQAAQVAAVAPMPGQAGIDRMVWSTMAAIDNANTTGNYSVLRDTAAPAFQSVNDLAKLTAIFAKLRGSGIDLSETLLLTPVFRTPPRLIQSGLLQVQGSFGMRPAAVNFELLYQWTVGRWRLFGVGIGVVPSPTEQASNGVTRPVAASPPPRRSP
jgi:hypothetical protein